MLSLAITHCGTSAYMFQTLFIFFGPGFLYGACPSVEHSIATGLEITQEDSPVVFELCVDHLGWTLLVDSGQSAAGTGHPFSETGWGQRDLQCLSPRINTFWWMGDHSRHPILGIMYFLIWRMARPGPLRLALPHQRLQAKQELLLDLVGAHWQFSTTHYHSIFGEPHGTWHVQGPEPEPRKPQGPFPTWQRLSLPKLK